MVYKVNIEFARLQNRESIKNGPEDREGFRINLGSFNYDNFAQHPIEYYNAFHTLVECNCESSEFFFYYHLSTVKIIPLKD
jgi:hypothetical protein